MKKTSKVSIAKACCLAVVLALGAGVAFAAETKGSAKGGASDLIQLTPIKTGEDIAGLKPGDQVVMACPKCKSMYVTRVVKENKPGKSYEVATTEHLCPGCGNKIEFKGHGKAGKEEITHVCKECGSKDAFCCVLKAGSSPTKGMEEPTKK
jgi:predicted RNA-binding Zn-ribbon protein involved in translation (DUF1610 family)